jgi:hypothetical protein
MMRRRPAPVSKYDYPLIATTVYQALEAGVSIYQRVADCAGVTVRRAEALVRTCKNLGLLPDRRLR